MGGGGRRGLEGLGYVLFSASAVGTGACFITYMLSYTLLTRFPIAVSLNTADSLPVNDPKRHLLFR